MLGSGGGDGARMVGRKGEVCVGQYANDIVLSRKEMKINLLLRFK